LGRVEVLDQLVELKKQGKHQLYEYIETLAFHPNINMQDVLTFWRNPDKFLNFGDQHTPEEVQNRKKPSNYTEIPNLDLTGEDLRDALVEGDMNKLQVFKALEIEYELPSEVDKEQNILQKAKEALGSYREKIPGKARQPKKLFSEINRVFKERGLKMVDFLGGILNLDADVEDEIMKLLSDPEIGLLQKGNVVKYRAKINLKSDPDGVVAGNDTACCMPFGSGKNNVYTFNPVCSLFTIQRQSINGSWRTVAQSVLTKDKNIGKLIFNVREQMEGMGKLDDILPEQVLEQALFTVACDNIEVAPAAKGNQLTKRQIELIYRDFMDEYLTRYAKEDKFDDSQVVIGKGYSDGLVNLQEIPNTFVPSAPVGYSDKMHSTVYQLKPSKAKGIKKQIKEPELRKLTEIQETQTTQPNISGLTFEDTLPVAYIEGKAYHDNESLIQYLHNMENGLIAKDINNAHKNRPNMSLKYTDDNNKVHGYVFAYEGIRKENVHDDYTDEDYDSAQEGEPIIYVSDLASDLKVKGVGGSLIKGFLEQYKVNYVDNKERWKGGKPIAIFAQTREKTSYAIINAKLPQYAKEIGLDFEIEELGQYQQGDDVMHEILLKVA